MFTVSQACQVQKEYKVHQVKKVHLEYLACLENQDHLLVMVVAPCILGGAESHAKGILL
jgi:hypothetical protein